MRWIFRPMVVACLLVVPLTAFGQAAPGTVIRDCAQCPPMVVLPQGAFLMGSPAAEKGRSKSEGPRHKVTIAYTIAIARHEVTFDEWDACVADGGCGGHHPDDDGYGRGSLPVIDVGWTDGQAYAAWLTQKTGKHYRLPTEAEWEYAARAGAATAYSWGDKPSRDFANYGQDTCCGGYAEGKDKWELSSPAESFPPNAFGVYDMLGNLWEWVEDCWNETYKNAPTDGSAWLTGDCDRRILRGGAWSSMPVRIRAAFRDAYPPDDTSTFMGFRVVRVE